MGFVPSRLSLCRSPELLKPERQPLPIGIILGSPRQLDRSRDRGRGTSYPRSGSGRAVSCHLRALIMVNACGRNASPSALALLLKIDSEPVREPLSPPKVYAPRRADPAARTRHRGKITNLKSDKVLGLTFNRRSCSAMALVTSKVKKILLSKGANASPDTIISRGEVLYVVHNPSSRRTPRSGAARLS